MPQGQISENNIRISIVIPKDLKLKADQMANADGRSLSGWIRKLITDAIYETPVITTNFDTLITNHSAIKTHCEHTENADHNLNNKSGTTL